jgi:hypothetical protein
MFKIDRANFRLLSNHPSNRLVDERGHQEDAASRECAVLVLEFTPNQAGLLLDIAKLTIR